MGIKKRGGQNVKCNRVKVTTHNKDTFKYSGLAAQIFLKLFRFTNIIFSTTQIFRTVGTVATPFYPDYNKLNKSQPPTVAPLNNTLSVLSTLSTCQAVMHSLDWPQCDVGVRVCRSAWGVP